MFWDTFMSVGRVVENGAPREAVIGGRTNPGWLAFANTDASFLSVCLHHLKWRPTLSANYLAL